MKRRNVNRNRTAGQIETSSFPWGLLLLAIAGAAIISTGLFFAATRHFASMQLGIANAKLRSQLQELNDEKRRLELERELALSPAVIKRTARSLGFQEAALLTNSGTIGVSTTSELQGVLREPVSRRAVTPSVTGESQNPSAQSRVSVKPALAVSSPKPAKEIDVKAAKTEKPETGRTIVSEDIRPRIAEVRGGSSSSSDSGIRRTVISAASTKSSMVVRSEKF
ncbi:hypothetical protein [Leptolyngbya sp. 7M]|uniref:hypothetical protein n=1 Tax=Leptolyngbya sp. 7M TaxID=2812896 RepID=UPI001B8CC8BA|nr:hypothetical protein [Leptolyngbya sp. 7M]QYO65919.1 hypothetical protein JVX88_03725 [Leptolyngbya sp. 7M]